MKNFKLLTVWKTGMEIVKQCYELAEFFPVEEKFALRLQITRSCVSIPSNIAEGSSRQSTKEYRRFLEIALGSCFELETQLHIAANILHIHIPIEVTDLLREEEKMLTSFINTLKANSL